MPRSRSAEKSCTERPPWFDQGGGASLDGSLNDSLESSGMLEHIPECWKMFAWTAAATAWGRVDGLAHRQVLHSQRCWEGAWVLGCACDRIGGRLSLVTHGDSVNRD